MREMRNSILKGSFIELYREKREWLDRKDDENPVKPPKRRRKSSPAMKLGAYEVLANELGYSSIRHVKSGEIMHSVSDPEEEARRLYVEQSDLTARLREEGPELVVWDVGLGAATNAMATLRATLAAYEAGARRPLHLVSFENDLDSLKLAMKHPTRFPHLHHGAPGSLVEAGVWTSSEYPLRWTLIQGDFLAEMKRAPLPDLVYYDPFSYKTDSALWTEGAFSELFSRCEGRPVEIFTYTVSTAARSALLSAGFWVARGVPTGPKNETTIGLTPEARRPGRELLGPEWLSRWERSSAPRGLNEARIRSHPQFANFC
jgi:queuine tRNA-ribosyltransferase